MIQKCIILLVACAVFVSGDIDVTHNDTELKKCALELNKCYNDIFEYIMTSNKTDRLCTNVEEFVNKVKEYNRLHKKKYHYILSVNKPFMLYTKFLYGYKDAKEYLLCKNNTANHTEESKGDSKLDITKNLFKQHKEFTAHGCTKLKFAVEKAERPGELDNCKNRFKQMNIDTLNLYLDECKRRNISTEPVITVKLSSPPLSTLMMYMIIGSLVLSTIFICFITYCVVKKCRNSKVSDKSAETKTP